MSGLAHGKYKDGSSQGQMVAFACDSKGRQLVAAGDSPLLVALSAADPVDGPAALSALNFDLLTGVENGWLDVSGYQTALIQIVASAGITAGQISFEQTNNIAAPALPVIAVESTSTSTNAILAGFSIAAGTNRLFKLQVDARFIRVRISAAFVGGTVRAYAAMSQKNSSYPVVGVQQQVAANLQVTATLATGVNTIGAVNANDCVFYIESVIAQAASAALNGATRDCGVVPGATVKFSQFNAFAFADQTGTLSIQVSIDNVTWRTAKSVAVAANVAQILSIPVMARYHRAVFVNGATANTAFMLNTSYSN